MLSDKEQEDLKTKSEIQRQLMKIVHRTWNIFTPEKKQNYDKNIHRSQIKNT